jgi:AcrR family transcriptional regulator
MPGTNATATTKRKPSRIAVERRRELIEAAIRDIASNGYDAVTVASICAEAGFSRGLIGHYFSSKEELLLEAVETVAVQLGEAIRDAANAAGHAPIERLHALIHASFTPPGLTADKVAVWVALASSARWSTSLAHIYRQIWVNYRAGVGRLFSRAAEERRLTIDAENVALAFSQLIEGLWIGIAGDPGTVTPAKAETCCHHYVDLMLNEAEWKKSTGRATARRVKKDRTGESPVPRKALRV